MEGESFQLVGFLMSGEGGPLCNTTKIRRKMEITKVYNEIVEELQSVQKEVIKTEFLDQSLEDNDSNCDKLVCLCCWLYF